MIAVICTAMICVAVMGVTLTLSKTEIKIIHTYPQQPTQQHDTEAIQKILDDEYEKNKVPTYGDILADINKILGGDDIE